MENSINPELNKITSSLFRVSAKVLIFQDDHLLIVKESEGWFGLPGGGVEHREDIIRGLIREVSEEIGMPIDASSITSLPIFIDSASVFGEIPRLTLLYIYSSQNTRITPQHSELRYQWVNKDELNTIQLAPNIEPMRHIIMANYPEKSS